MHEASGQRISAKNRHDVEQLYQHPHGPRKFVQRNGLHVVPPGEVPQDSKAGQKHHKEEHHSHLRNWKT